MNRDGIDSMDKSDGEIWKKIRGTKNRIAAYLWFNVEVGGVFTLAEVRTEIDVVNQTQTDRRLRELREQGWVIEGYKDSKGMKSNSYILKKKGNRIWAGEKNQRDAISNKLRRQVFARDNNTCVVCGISAGEPYIDALDEKARMTIGHRVPNQRLGNATLENLQTECSRCNEPIRNLLKDPETFEDLLGDINRLDLKSIAELSQWIHEGRRTPRLIDIIYSRYRYLSPHEKSSMKAYISQVRNYGSNSSE